MKLDQAVVAVLRGPINNVWQQIASDLFECDPDLDNEGAVESCIDANRLLLNGNNKEADDLVHTLCKEHGYDKVLSKNIQLV